MGTAFSVRKVARHVIDCNECYGDDLLDVVSHLLDKQFGVEEGDAYQRMLELDELRFQKTEELAQLMGLDNWKEDKEQQARLNLEINERFSSLQILERRKLAREIKFLFNVAATLMHW